MPKSQSDARVPDDDELVEAELVDAELVDAEVAEAESGDAEVVEGELVDVALASDVADDVADEPSLRNRMFARRRTRLATFLSGSLTPRDTDDDYDDIYVLREDGEIVAARTARLWSRVVARGLDLAFTFVYLSLLNQIGISAIQRIESDLGFGWAGTIVGLVVSVVLLAALVVGLLFEPYAITRWGRTPGKWFMKLMVCPLVADEKADFGAVRHANKRNRLTFKYSLRRLVWIPVFLIPLAGSLIVLAGHLVAYWHRQRLNLWDRFAKSAVLRDPYLPPAKQYNPAVARWVKKMMSWGDTPSKGDKGDGGKADASRSKAGGKKVRTFRGRKKRS